MPKSRKVCRKPTNAKQTEKTPISCGVRSRANMTTETNAIACPAIAVEELNEQRPANGHLLCFHRIWAMRVHQDAPQGGGEPAGGGHRERLAAILGDGQQRRFNLVRDRTPPEILRVRSDARGVEGVAARRGRRGYRPRCFPDRRPRSESRFPHAARHRPLRRVGCTAREPRWRSPRHRRCRTLRHRSRTPWRRERRGRPPDKPRGVRGLSRRPANLTRSAMPRSCASASRRGLSAPSPRPYSGCPFPL